MTSYFLYFFIFSDFPYVAISTTEGAIKSTISGIVITFVRSVEFSSVIICRMVLFSFAFSSEHETIEKITNKRVINIVGLLIVTKVFSQRIFKLILQFYDHRCFKINNT